MAGEKSGWHKADGGQSFAALVAALPAHYERSEKWSLKGSAVAADRYSALSPNRLTVNIAERGFVLESQQTLDLSLAANWDSIAVDYTVAATRAGKDFYIYACQQTGAAPKILISANSTAPAGYTASTSRKIAGFHCLCLSVGTIAGHTLTGFLTGDILPASIWDLKHKPREATPAGMVYVDEIGKWVDIYLASGTGAATASVFNATISDTRDWMSFVDDGAAVKKRLLRDYEFQRMAAGSNEETNIFGSADPVTTGGHVDTASRRMISNFGVEDACGAMHQWLDEQGFRCDPDGSVQAAALTFTVTRAAVPGGNPIYMKWDGAVPYLCCNMAAATADKFVGPANYKVNIKHDAAAATGGLPVYFDDDATQPARLLVNNTAFAKDVFILTNNPAYMLQVKHSATANSLGVALYYDDGADNRLEANNASGVDQSLDLALNSQGFAYYDLPGAKGSIYRQGTNGDVKLLAGLYWASGTNCGSRGRTANSYRWAATTDIGGRFAAEPV